MGLAFLGGEEGAVTPPSVNIALFIYSTSILNSGVEANLSKTLTVFSKS